MLSTSDRTGLLASPSTFSGNIYHHHHHQAGSASAAAATAAAAAAAANVKKTNIPSAMVADPQKRQQLVQQKQQSTTAGVTGNLNDEQRQHIWIVTGPAGCGKSTVASGLAREFELPFIEGDDYHPDSNKEKMAKGQPLNDADRWDWLIKLREAAVKALSTPKKDQSQTQNNKDISSNSNSSSSSSNSNSDATACPAGVVVTCSALKHKYRDVMRIAAYEHPTVSIHFVYLRADEKDLVERVTQRKGHFMKSDMVHSQFDALEEPTGEEWDAACVECGNERSKEEVLEEAKGIVKRAFEEEGC